jgi:hypothetical protein
MMSAHSPEGMSSALLVFTIRADGTQLRDRLALISAFSLMFCGSRWPTLASMSDIDPRAETPLVDRSELGVSGLLPTGTVTLLLADVEGSTRPWETQPEQMTAAMARMNKVVSETMRSPARWNCSAPRWPRSACRSWFGRVRRVAPMSGPPQSGQPQDR